MKEFGVLITGCSKHSKNVVDCLKNNSDNVNVRVYGVDCSEQNLLRTGLDGCGIVPPITSPNYIDSLISFCKEHDISVILPYITIELQLLSENVSRFEENGIKVSVGNPHSLFVVNDKIRLSEKFSSLMPMQAIAKHPEDVIRFANEVDYPNNTFCVKLSNKCGGAGFAIVDDKKANDISLFNKAGVNRYITFQSLLEIFDHNPTLEIICQKYESGKDYSVCVLSDGSKNLHKCGYVGHVMHYGAVISGEILHNQQAYDIADDVISKVGLEGNACFDFILKEDGSAVLLEVNPRINASLPFVAAAGLNLPYLRCKQLLGYDISKPCAVKYGLKMSKYYECEYYV